MDISNGERVGISLFVQGCRFCCSNCFNKDTWDFNGGKEWTPEVEDKFIELASRPYIKRISILGGEPLADENLDGVLNLINKIRLLMPEKTIWLYTGYKAKLIQESIKTDDFWNDIDEEYSYFSFEPRDSFINTWKRIKITKLVDVLVDGRYIDSQRDISLRWRGSKNQRVIDIKESLQQGEVVLYCE